MQGCLDWQRAGMGAPPEVRIATADYRVDMDTLGEFLSASCEVEEAAKVSSLDLYDEYKRWAADVGERPVTHKRFSLWMEHRGKDVGFHKEHSRDGKIWHGLRLTYSPAPEARSGA